MKITRNLCAALAAAAHFAFAADLPITQTAPVIVTATRFPQDPSAYPVGVTVITAADIQRSTARTVPELLNKLPGIHTRDLSGSPNLQVDMRGFGIFGDQNTLVLLDGQRISENEQAPVDWAAIPLSAIERIEIMRGSGAVLYGGGATGGTINIITKAPQPGARTAYVYGGAGNYGTFASGAGADLAGANAGLRANASHYESANYRDNNRVRVDNAQADMRWWGDTHTLSVKFGADDERQGLPGSISEAQIAANRRQAATPEDFGTQRGGHVNVGSTSQLAFGDFAVNLGYREKDTDASFFVGTPFRNNVETRATVWSLTPRLKIPYGFAGTHNTLVTGVDADLWTFDSTAGPSTVGRPHATQRNRAVYLQQTTALSGSATVSTGLREHWVSYGVNDPANPGAADSRARHLTAYEIAGRERLAPGIEAYAKLGTSFRVPNVNDIYSLFSASVTMLEPQTSHDKEIGTRIDSRFGRYRVALYRMNIDNEIFYDSATFTNRNLPPTRREGLELGGKWRPMPRLDLYANYTYSVAKFRAGDFGGVSIAGKDVPLVPRHSANVGLGWAFTPKLRAHVTLRYVGTERFDSDETNTFAGKMPAYKVVDAKVTRDTKRWRFTGAVRNLFNEKYFSYGVYTGFPTYSALPAPERSVFVTARYSFR